MLTHVLKLHFGWHLARVKCLSCLIIALFKVKTVNFVELATAFSGTAKVDSHYRRIQPFFKEVNIDQATVARLVASLLPYDQLILSLDRTNWMLGCFAINFLVLSVVPQAQLFPCFWILLPKQGNSNIRSVFSSSINSLMSLAVTKLNILQVIESLWVNCGLII